MSNVIEEVRLIFSDVDNNNNKFWHGRLYDNDDVEVEWGRVGYKAQSKLHSGVGSRKLESLKKSKLKKGYTEQKTVAGSKGTVTASASPGKHNLKAQAQSDIEGCSEVKKLVAWLADVNIHNIQTNTKITYNKVTGTFETPLGLVTLDAISEARELLDDLAPYVVDQDWEHRTFKNAVNDYCRLIPQNVGMKRGWHKALFADKAALVKQNDILDSLDASLVSAKTTKVTKGDNKGDRVWDVSMELVKNSRTVERIRKKYQRSKGNHYDVKDLDVKRVFTLKMPSIEEAFNKDGKKVGGIKQLWHGTKASNLLSILKVGLVIPPSSSGHCTGRMFGNGVYFSDQSTKAIRYATNAWTGGGNTNRTFMFLADVAMGNPYTPTRSNWNFKPPKGYDSCFARAGQSGVMNNEMVVYRTSQVNLVHLIEFTKHGR